MSARVNKLVFGMIREIPVIQALSDSGDPWVRLSSLWLDGLGRVLSFSAGIVTDVFD